MLKEKCLAYQERFSRRNKTVWSLDLSKITVITPTWNQAAYIKDTIDSVINQTHKDIEYIIVDNMSDDGTREIVEEYVSKDNRIVYIREADHGQAEAINKGIKAASGDIVCWLNSDDFFYDNLVLEKVNSLFDNNQDVGIIAGDGWYCDKEKKPTVYNNSDRNDKGDLIKRWYYIVQPSVFWRRNDMLLDEQYHYVFDWKFFAGMFSEKKVLYSHEPYSVYRMYEDNKTGQDNAKRKKEVYLLQRELETGRLNISWCRHVWKKYEEAEKKNSPSIKKRMDFYSKILFHISGKKICCF